MRLGRQARPETGADARGHQSRRPILVVLALFVIVFSAIYIPLFYASAQTRAGVRQAVQEKCGLSSAAVAGEISIHEGDVKLPYVDSTGAHTAIAYVGTRQTYFVASCGR
jgi:hypothetical protein